MIVVVDYGMGNLKSISKALEHVGFKVKVSSEVQDVKSSNAIVLPGVGAFKDAVRNLKRLGLWEVIREEVLEKKKFILGICLGFQMFFEKSTEFGEEKGFSFLKGTALKFPERNCKVPHIGWNRVYPVKDSALLEGLSGEYFYFVHSYYLPENSEGACAYTEYCGIRFTSCVEKGNILGVQFHPEKSQKSGLKVLENFKRILAVL